VEVPTLTFALGGKDLGLHKKTGVEGLVVSGPIAFLGTTYQPGGFQIWDVSNPADIKAPSSCNIYNYSEKASGLDFVDDYVFTSNNSQQALRVIWNINAVCS